MEGGKGKLVGERVKWVMCKLRLIFNWKLFCKHDIEIIFNWFFIKYDKKKDLCGSDVIAIYDKLLRFSVDTSEVMKEFYQINFEKCWSKQQQNLCNLNLKACLKAHT